MLFRSVYSFRHFRPTEGGSSSKNFSIFSDDVTIARVSFLSFFYVHFRPATAALFVCCCVAIPTKQLEIVEAQRDLRTLDRDRIDLDFMVNYFARLIDPTTQTILT